MKIAVGAVGTSILLASAPAGAQTKAHALRWSPALDTAVTVAGATAWIASELLKGSLAPAQCRWCEANDVDAGVRAALVWHDTASAGQISNVTGFLLTPLAAVGIDVLAAAHDGALYDAPEDALLMAEAGVLAADVDQITKFLVGRERPFVHALASADKPLTPHPSDNNLSFFSGHSSEAFALAAASGTIGELRGYRWAPLAWGVGGVFAAMTAYLRIAADKHWWTDVVVGAVVGAGIGVAVPCLFHSAADMVPHLPAPGARLVPAPPAVPTMTVTW